MALTLRDGVYNARTLLGEQIPNYWYTNDLIYHLNWAAQDMCSEAQCLETVFQTNYPANQQEVALPTWIDKITGVAVYSGQLFQLQALDDYTDVQIANRVGNIPQSFYTKIGTPIMSPQGTPKNPTGNIVPVPILAPPNADDYTTVLGLWPFPGATMPVTIWCTRYHPWVITPEAPIQIPARFAMDWIAYAVARGKEKESMLDEANYWQQKYDAGRQRFVDYWIQRKQSKTAPSYGGVAWPTLARGSSSVIFLDQSPTLINQ